MILRCIFLFFVFVNDFVHCADASATAKKSALMEISVLEDDSITESSDAETTFSNENPDYWRQNQAYSEATSSTTLPQQNASQLEDFLIHDFITSPDDEIPTTQISLEIPSGIDENEDFNYTEKQETEEVSHSRLFTTLLNLEEDYNMSFDKMAKLYVAENAENNLEKNRRRKGRQHGMDAFADLEDDLVESELIKQDVKYKSLGIEPLALVVVPEGRARTPIRETTTTIPPWEKQYEKTSYLLTSGNEMDTSPFIAKWKSAKQLELQGEDLNNITHRAAFLKKNPENTVYLLPPLTVELAEDTTLLMNANERQEIPFEVSNNLNNAARVTFTVRDELGILLEIDRYIAILGPHARTTVRVAVLPKSGQSSDRITFIATGSEQVRKEVIVDIESNYGTDTDAPYIDYSYTSDCTDVVLSKCKEGTWTIKILAKDTDSGLKLLTTMPKGLYFPDGYTAGTKEEVTGIYSESCCNADLQIIAIDRMNNRNVKQINAYRAPLSFWAVIAITLVSLIFLTIIIVSSLICLKKCKRNEADSFDLPTYRGGRSRY